MVEETGDWRLASCRPLRKSIEGCGAISSTSLEKSLHGHLIGFAADQSRLEQRTVEIKRVYSAG
jgi:hypothetical protein